MGDGVNELVGKGLGSYVQHFFGGVVFEDLVADSVHQVSLAQAGLTVNEERVVCVARRVGDGDRGGAGHAVAVAHDERIEGVLLVQMRLKSAGLERGFAYFRELFFIIKLQREIVLCAVHYNALDDGMILLLDLIEIKLAGNGKIRGVINYIFKNDRLYE